MTAYTRNDLDEGWEFKFLRASTSKFRDPVRLQVRQVRALEMPLYRLTHMYGPAARCKRFSSIWW